MAWYDTPSIDVGRGQLLTPFWHCYGANACEIDAPTIVAMAMASKANLFPINTHDYARPLIIGNGDVTWDTIRKGRFIDDLVPCLNINLRVSADAAIHTTRQAFGETGIDLLKLEVLNPDLHTANDQEVIEAAKVLAADGFRILPLITANPDAAAELHAIGCPLVRIQGSPIGSGLGIEDPEAVKACVAAGPTILDCGIGSADHVLEAFRLGCVGFLVDWLLFKDDEPVQAINDLRARLDAAGPRRAPDLVGESDWVKEWEGALPPRLVA